MDLDFLRALSGIENMSQPLCILRRDDTLVICTDLEATYADAASIPSKSFATGWQHASGETGQWHTWNSVIPVTHFQGLPLESFPQTGLDPAKEVWESSLDRNTFIKTVETMQDDMRSGDYYLANLTRMLESHISTDPYFIAALSCIVHDTPFRFFHHDPNRSVLGLSPERFLRIESQLVTCEPMKGTATSEMELVNSAKEHEENTMMIDLVRSDLSRICTAETISVITRDKISVHPGLVQMSSVLQGTLDKMEVAAAIKEMMPVASVTGTPKPYVVKKIDEYETHERDIYCGAYGWIDTTASACDLAVSIRTIDMTHKSVRIGIGAGITLRSNPEQEWEETELKASRLTSLVDQSTPIETSGVFTCLRVESPTRTFLLKEHCERLSRHASSLGIPISCDEIYAAASSYLAATKPTSSWLNISINTTGTIECTSHPLPVSPPSIVMGIAPAPSRQVEVPKYMHRELYDNAFVNAQGLASEKIDDAFLLIRGLITETTRANFFIRIGDEFITPAMSGIIYGIGRASTLDFLREHAIDVHERPITINDLLAADEIVTTNSVRGALPVRKICSALLDDDRVLTNSNTTLLTLASQAFTTNITNHLGERE